MLPEVCVSAVAARDSSNNQRPLLRRWFHPRIQEIDDGSPFQGTRVDVTDCGQPHPRHWCGGIAIPRAIRRQQAAGIPGVVPLVSPASAMPRFRRPALCRGFASPKIAPGVRCFFDEFGGRMSHPGAVFTGASFWIRFQNICVDYAARRHNTSPLAVASVPVP
jgi:hypothetical protein